MDDIKGYIQEMRRMGEMFVRRVNSLCMNLECHSDAFIDYDRMIGELRTKLTMTNENIKLLSNKCKQAYQQLIEEFEKSILLEHHLKRTEDVSVLHNEILKTTQAGLLSPIHNSKPQEKQGLSQPSKSEITPISRVATKLEERTNPLPHNSYTLDTSQDTKACITEIEVSEEELKSIERQYKLEDESPCCKQTLLKLRRFLARLSVPGVFIDTDTNIDNMNIHNYINIQK